MELLYCSHVDGAFPNGKGTKKRHSGAQPPRHPQGEPTRAPTSSCGLSLPIALYHAATKCARLKCSRYGPTQDAQLQIKSETPPPISTQLRDPPPKLNSTQKNSNSDIAGPTNQSNPRHRRIAGMLRRRPSPVSSPATIPQHPRVTHHTHAPSPCSHFARHPTTPGCSLTTPGC